MNRFANLIALANSARRKQISESEEDLSKIMAEMLAPAVASDDAPVADRILTVPCANNVAVAESAVVDDATKAWLKSEREKIGLPEDHPNALYLHSVVTHTGKPMQNAYNDVLLTEEVEKSLPGIIGQPVDIRYGEYFDWNTYEYRSDGFDGHERERHGGMNGIRGWVYAARLNGDAVECGVMLWAYEFPEVIDTLVDEIEFMGASFDILGSTISFDSEGHRILKDLSFCGFAILYKVKAADRDTSVGAPEYRGIDLMIDALEKEVASGSRVPIMLLPVDSNVGAMTGATAGAADSTTKGGSTNMSDQNKGTDDQVAATQAGQEAEISRLSTENERLSTENTDLRSQLAAAEAERDAAVAERDSVTAERDAAIAERDQLTADLNARDEAEAQAQRTSERMAEMLELGAFASEEAEAQARDTVGTLSDEDYRVAKAEHRADVAERKTAAVAAGGVSAIAARGGLGSANTGGDRIESDPRAIGASLAKQPVDSD